MAYILEKADRDLFTAGTTQRTGGSASLSIGERCHLYGILM